MVKSNNIKKVKAQRIVYLDNASATPIDKNVLNKMNKVFKENYSNPNALHEDGLKTKKLLEESRLGISKILNSSPREVVFTSGSTESNNLAIFGIVNKFTKNKIPHIITSNIEHASVLEVFKYLELTKKAKVTYLEVERNGVISINKLKKALKENTVLVSIMHANNEIGSVQPIKEIAKIIRHHRKNSKKKSNIFPIFHSDATQAINYLPINVQKLGIDLMSFNGGKIYGPKGVGVLFKKKDLDLLPLIFGGEQEFGLRSGTVNTPLVFGLKESLILTQNIKEKEVKRLIILKKYFVKKLKDFFQKSKFNFTLNGDTSLSLPNIINITIPKIPSDLLLIELSMRGIHVSEKSACKSGDKKNSHVLEALGYKKTDTINSIRFSLGRETTKKDLNYVISSLSNILKKLEKWYI